MGNRIDKVFITKAYDNIVKELREKIGKPFEKDRSLKESHENS